MPSVKIIPFEPQYSKHFRDLNVQWLEKYFYVEKKDVELLEDSEKNIIDKGGYIFFAKYGQKIVGCFAFINVEDKSYELGKMAVDPEYQGLKIGQTLLVFAVDYAKKSNWNQIILYSSTKLDTALHIYRKYGFQEVVLEDDSVYARSDIKMELNL